MFDPFPSLPHQVRQYSITSLVGRGGFGTVYKATNQIYNLEFAIKVIPMKSKEEDANKERTFDSEVQSLMNLDHPHVIRMYDFFRENGFLFLVLEFCEGGTKLDDNNFLKNLSDLEKIHICSRISAALNYCHNMSIAHRDIKTSNILFDSFDRVKICDFGLSEHIKPGEMMKEFCGSYLYAPPELFRKNAFNPFKADVWSLGVLFYKIMNNGSYPWPLTSKEDVKNAILSDRFQSLPTNFHLGKIVRKMVVMNPDARISMEEINNTFISFLSKSNSIPSNNISILSKSILSNQASSLNNCLSSSNRSAPAMENKYEPRKRRISKTGSGLFIMSSFQTCSTPRSMDNIDLRDNIKKKMNEKRRSLTIDDKTILTFRTPDVSPLHS